MGYLARFQASLVKEFFTSPGKESARNVGEIGSIPGLTRSPGGAWPPTPVFLPEEFHGQGSLVVYSPWGHKESDMTEQLALSLPVYLHLI